MYQECNISGSQLYCGGASMFRKSTLMSENRNVSDHCILDSVTLNKIMNHALLDGSYTSNGNISLEFGQKIIFKKYPIKGYYFSFCIKPRQSPLTKHLSFPPSNWFYFYFLLLFYKGPLLSCFEWGTNP